MLGRDLSTPPTSWRCRRSQRLSTRKCGLFSSLSLCISAGKAVSLAFWAAAAQFAGVAYARRLPSLDGLSTSGGGTIHLSGRRLLLGLLVGHGAHYHFSTASVAGSVSISTFTSGVAILLHDVCIVAKAFKKGRCSRWLARLYDRLAVLLLTQWPIRFSLFCGRDPVACPLHTTSSDPGLGYGASIH